MPENERKYAKLTKFNGKDTSSTVKNTTVSSYQAPYQGKKKEERMKNISNALNLLEKSWETWTEIEKREKDQIITQNNTSSLKNSDESNNKDAIIARLEEGLISTTTQVMTITKQLNASEANREFVEKQLNECKEKEDEYKKRIISLETSFRQSEKRQEECESSLKEMHGIRDDMQIELVKIYMMKEDILSRCNVLETEYLKTKRDLEITSKENTFLRKLLAIAESVTGEMYTIDMLKDDEINKRIFGEKYNQSDKILKQNYEKSLMEIEDLKTLLANERNKRVIVAKKSVLDYIKSSEMEVERCKEAIEKLNNLLSGNVNNERENDKHLPYNNFLGLCSAAAETVNARERLNLTLKKIEEMKPDKRYKESDRYKIESYFVQREEINILRNKLRERPIMKSESIDTNDLNECMIMEEEEKEKEKEKEKHHNSEEIIEKHIENNEMLENVFIEKKKEPLFEPSNDIDKEKKKKQQKQQKQETKRTTKRRFIYDIDI